MKNLVLFLDEIQQNHEWKDYLQQVDDFPLLDNVLQYFQQICTCDDNLTNEQYKYLYTQGFTYRELSIIGNRHFQSIAVSLSKLLTEQDVKTHKENRKKWIFLMNHMTFVYPVDTDGNFDNLLQQYPNKTLKDLKRIYRANGGKKLLEKRQLIREQENERIKQLLREQKKIREISLLLNKPQTTIRHRIKKMQQAQEIET